MLKQGTTTINGPHQCAWIDTVTGDGAMTLYVMNHSPDKKLCHMANLLLQKWPRRSFSCVTKVNLGNLKEGACAGIVSLATNYAALVGKAVKDGYDLYLGHGMRKEEEEHVKLVREAIPEILHLRYTVVENG